MAKLIRALKIIRNNWKKSLLGVAVLSYSAQYGKNKYDDLQLMRSYCEKALKYGTAPLPAGSRCRQVTVILNPAANRRKAKKNFEKFCAPLLHLAGIFVNIIQTEYEGQTRSLMENLENSTDAVVIAGGDGTLSEAVTGLLRRSDRELVLQRKFPLGILPLGQSNTVARSLFGNTNAVKMMAEATMSVIREVIKPIDVMRVQVIENAEEESKPPVYSLAGIEWGAYRDALSKRDKYWYWGALRSYVAYVFMGLKGEKSGMTWQCIGHLQYVLPCSGCSKCYVMPQKAQTRWWQAFTPKQASSTVEEDYSKVVNVECGQEFKEDISAVDFRVTLGKLGHMEVFIGPKVVTYLDFIAEGWRRLRDATQSTDNILCVRELKLKPVLPLQENSPSWISIDNEDYELKALQATLLKNQVYLFCCTNE